MDALLCLNSHRFFHVMGHALATVLSTLQSLSPVFLWFCRLALQFSIVPYYNVHYTWNALYVLATLLDLWDSLSSLATYAVYGVASNQSIFYGPRWCFQYFTVGFRHFSWRFPFCHMQFHILRHFSRLWSYFIGFAILWGSSTTLWPTIITSELSSRDI